MDKLEQAEVDEVKNIFDVWHNRQRDLMVNMDPRIKREYEAQCKTIWAWHDEILAKLQNIAKGT